MSNGQPTLEEFLGLDPSGPMIGQEAEEPDPLRVFLGLEGQAIQPEKSLLQRVNEWSEAIRPLVDPTRGGGPMILAGLIGSPKQRGRFASLTAGVAETALATGANAMEIPVVVEQAFRRDEDTALGFLTKGADFLRAQREMLDAAAIRVAMGQGLTEQEARDINGLGEFAGYVAPGAAAWKAAGLVTMRGTPFLTGNLVRDMTAGAIFGAAFTEGDVSERLTGAGSEALFSVGVYAGLAGAFGMMIGAPRLALRAYRLLRLETEAETVSLLKRINETRDPMSGIITLSNLDEDTARLVNRQLSEEHFISQTEGGIRTAIQRADLSAFVQGVLDMNKGNASHGIVRDVADPGTLLQRIRQDMPGIKFHEVKKAKGISDIIFGTTELTPTQVGEFSRMQALHGDLAMIPGQRFKRGKHDYVFAKMAGRSFLWAARTGDGAVKKFKVDGKISPYNSIAPDMPGAPGTLIDDFLGWMDDKLKNLARARTHTGLEELDKIDPSRAVFRDYPRNTPDVIDPADAGLPVHGKPFMIEFDIPPMATEDPTLGPAIREAIVSMRPMRFIDVTQAQIRSPNQAWIVEVEGNTIGFLTPQDIMNAQNLPYLRAVDQQSGRFNHFDPVFSVKAVVTPSAKRRSGGREGFQMTFFGMNTDGTLIPHGHVSHPTLDTLLGEAQRHGFTPTNQEYVDELLQGFDLRSALQSGDAFLLDPTEPVPFFELVNMWAEERGIVDALTSRDPNFRRVIQARITGLTGRLKQAVTKEERARLLLEISNAESLLKHPIDLDSFTVLAAKRAQERAFQMLDPQERRLFTHLQDRLEEFVDQLPDDLAMRAAEKGLFATKLENGTVLLRHMDTGTPIIYKNEAAALEGLRSSFAETRDFLDNFGLPPTGGGGGGLFGGVTGGDVPDGVPLEWLDPDMPLGPVDEKALKRAIRLATDKRPRIWLQPVSEILASIESGTGTPVWSKVFLPLLEGIEARDASLVNIENTIARIFKGYSKRDVLHLFDYMREIEGKNLTPKQLTEVQKRLGVTPKLESLRTELRKLYDFGFDIAVNQLGLSRRDYITDYVSRIQPLFEKVKLFDDEAYWAVLEKSGIKLTAADKAWFLKARTGNLAQVEKDLRLVTLKYFRELYFDVHVKKPYDHAFRLVERELHGPNKGQLKNPLGLNNLPPDQRAKVIEALGGDAGLQGTVGLIEGVLTAVRGNPQADGDALSGLMTRLFRLAGVQVEPEVVKTFINLGIANIYGGLMGFRPRVVIRDSLTNFWLQYTRIGPKHMGRGLEIAMTPEGLSKARQAGALQLRSLGLEMGEVAFDEMVSAMPIKPVNTLGHGTAVLMRGIAGGARVGRKASRIGLLGFSSLDEMLRAWSFWSQRLHTKEWLDKVGVQEIIAGGRAQERFFEHGIPFAEFSKKQEFVRRLRNLGEDQALDYIATNVGAHETNFIYKLMANPAILQSSGGKMAGMFGTWPIWAREAYHRAWRNATWSQRAKFAYRTGIMMAATGVLAYETGTDLYTWLAPTSWMTYAGGPALDVANDLLTVVGGPGYARAGAMNNLATRLPGMTFPGMTMARDVSQGIANGQTPEHQLYIMMLGRAQRGENYALQYLLRPSEDVVPATFRNLGLARRKRMEMSQMLELPESARPTLSKGLLQALQEQQLSSTPPSPHEGAAPIQTPGVRTPSQAVQERTPSHPPFSPGE